MTALQAWWQTKHCRAPYLMTTFGHVDALVEALRAAPGQRVAARLVLHPSVRPYMSTGTPDHDLIIGVDGTEELGSLRLTMPDTIWYAVGKPADDDRWIVYRLLGGRQAFPPDSLIPLDDIRAAVKDFLINSGCRRPAGLAWAEWPPAEPLRLARISV
jgi:Immunity protein Imm1